MKSSNEALHKRGLFTTEDINKFQNYSDHELFLLIDSPIPAERSAAIFLLSGRFHVENLGFIHALLERLCIEKCLYTKLEICKALENGNTETAKLMLPYLGRIGNNQYKALPNRSSSKKSYPLARDIIARSLGRMNTSILPVLFHELKHSHEEQISELIDAIGYMLFYNPHCIKDDYFNSVIDLMEQYSENKLIVWKCITCLSSFRTQACINKLTQIIDNNQNNLIQSEAERSLALINRN